MSQSRLLPIAVLAGLLAAAVPASASYHHVEIEKIVGGVQGDATAQVIQLRIKEAGTNVEGLQIVACDAAGNNPVTIFTIPANVANNAFGSRILLCTAAMLGKLSPPIVPEFVFTTVIPQAYLAAGTLYIDHPGDAIGPLWRLSWGGANYSGPGTVEPINDNDGNANPAYGAGIPINASKMVRFRYTADIPGDTNNADYVSDSNGSVHNNAGQPATINTTTPVAAVSWGEIKARFGK